MQGDIFAKVHLLETREGGRRGATPENFLSCRIRIHGRQHDCRVLMGPDGSLRPGETADRTIKFVNREVALKGVAVGDEFDLLELGKIGAGRVLAIL